MFTGGMEGRRKGGRKEGKKKGENNESFVPKRGVEIRP